MAKKSEQPLQTHKLRLVEGDFDKMAILFPSIGATVAIRHLVNNFVRKHQLATTELDIPIEPTVTELLESHQ